MTDAVTSTFADRHVGPDQAALRRILDVVGVDALADLAAKALPAAILDPATGGIADGLDVVVGVEQHRGCPVGRGAPGHHRRGSPVHGEDPDVLEALATEEVGGQLGGPAYVVRVRGQRAHAGDPHELLEVPTDRGQHGGDGGAEVVGGEAHAFDPRPAD